MDRKNNFDLLRLLAASQVMLLHTSSHLRVPLNDAVAFTVSAFPGMPVFFTISGFLVYASFERAGGLGTYLSNRFLRLYPAMWICLLVTICLLIACSELGVSSLVHVSFWSWLIAQLTFFQFYTPDMLRNWGCGTPNGSLWTIAVEVQYYLIVPLVSWLVNRAERKSIIFPNLLLIGLILASIGSNPFRILLPDGLLMKSYRVTLIPYLYNFLIGVLIYRNWDRIKVLFEEKVLLWTLLYGAYYYLFTLCVRKYPIAPYWEAIMVSCQNIILACWTISAAFSYKTISTSVLHGQDISYGIYIYHMLAVNTFIYLGLLNDIRLIFVVFALVYAIAFASWMLVEKPALSLKNRALMPRT